MTMCPFRQIGILENITELPVLLDMLRFKEISLYTRLLED
jgi:hypothetical protein